jgi:hypothetical protein
VFCSVHSPAAAHECVAAQSDAAYLISSATVAYPRVSCVSPGCTEVVSLANRATCQACGQVTCFIHRFQDLHACLAVASTVPIKRHVMADAVAKAAATTTPIHTDTPRLAVATLSRPLATSGSSSILSDKVRRMRIKSRAVVNPSILEPYRIFVEVCGAAVCPPPTSAPLCLCASRQWTVGMLLEAICKARGVRNPNASTTDEMQRLHVFVSGSPLAYADTLDALEKAGVLQDGASLEVALGISTGRADLVT